MGLRHVSSAAREVNRVDVAGVSGMAPLRWWRYLSVIGVQVGVSEYSGLARVDLPLALKVLLRLGSSLLVIDYGVKFVIFYVCALWLQHSEQISLVNSDFFAEILDDFFEFHNSFQLAIVE